MKLLTIMGQSISTNEKGLVSLTDLWKAGGGEERNRPKDWLKADGNIQFMRELAKGEDSTLFVQVKPGRNGGTFAHWQIALAYAKYLSPKLHMAVNDIYMRYKMADPSLAVDVVDRVEDPEALEYISRRARSKAVYRKLSSAVFALGGGMGTISIIADINNVSVTGMTAKELKNQAGIKPYKSSRELFDSDELAQVTFVESLQTKAFRRSDGGHRALTSLAMEVATQVQEVVNKHAA